VGVLTRDGGTKTIILGSVDLEAAQLWANGWVYAVEKNIADFDVSKNNQMQVLRSKPILHMNRMAAENPVWIVTVENEVNHDG